MNTKFLSPFSMALLSGLVVNLPPVLADYYPSIGSPLRTNSTECRARYQDVYGLLNTYFNGVPAFSSLRRLDVLAGGIPNSDATAAPPSGRVQLLHQVIASSYSSAPYGTMLGEQTLGDDRMIQKIVDSEASVIPANVASGLSVSIHTRHTGCSEPLGDYITLAISKKWNGIFGYKFDGSLNLTFRGEGPLCSNGGATLLASIQAKKTLTDALEVPQMTINGSPVADAELDTDEKVQTKATALASLPSSSYSIPNPPPPYLSSSSDATLYFYEDSGGLSPPAPSASLVEQIRYYKRIRSIILAYKTFLGDLVSPGLLKTGVPVSTLCSKVR